MRPGGYAIGMDVAGKVTEADTITCCHCNRVVHLPPRADPNRDYGFCRKCMKPTCRSPGCTTRCVPTERWLAAQERAINDSLARARARQSYTQS